jgi:hypothetical protein
MKPLREHYTQPTDQGDMLNVFDYIEALEKHIEELSPTTDEDSLPISKVVFFELKNGKYLASNGVEVTTEFILKHEHAIFHDNGYVIVERQ